MNVWCDCIAALILFVQVRWIRSLWRSVNHQQLLILLLLVQRRKSKVVEFPLVSCRRQHLPLVFQHLRRRSGRHWRSSTRHSLYLHNTATTRSYEVNTTVRLHTYTQTHVCCNWLRLLCASVFSVTVIVMLIFHWLLYRNILWIMVPQCNNVCCFVYICSIMKTISNIENAVFISALHQ